MAVFFPVLQAGLGSVAYTGEATVYPDTTESAWSIMERLAQTASITSDAPVTLTVAESTKVLSLASTASFSIVIGSSAFYTGFSSGAANPHLSAAISSAHVVTGLTVPSRPFSFEGSKASSTGAATGGGLFRRGAVMVSCSDTYAVLFALAKALRGGTWDVVQDARWQCRLRVTGCRLVPQARGQANVTLEVSGQVVA